MVGTVITCVSDEEDFPKDVYSYLYAELEKHKQFEEGKNIVVKPELVIFDAENSLIHVDEASRIPKEVIKWILESYLKSNPSRFKGYDLIEFGDTFTIGKILHPSQMEVLTCEICGFFTPYSEELYTHRMTHFGI